MTVLQAARPRGLLARTAGSTAARVIVVCSAAAWVVLGVMSVSGTDEQAGVDHDGHSMTLPGGVVTVDGVDPWTAGWAAAWLLMVVAMMWPLAIPTLDAVSRAGFRSWRTRLTLVTLATLTLLWLGLGLIGASIASAAGVPAGSVWWQLAWVGVAIALTRSARRARLLWTCLRLGPLAPGGRRGVGTAAQAGVVTWRRCALLCGPVMLAMTVGHSPVVLVAGSLVAWWEAWHPRAWRDPVPLLLLVVAAAWLAVTIAAPGAASHG